MKWVYILQCKDGYFYVGETSRLYRRFWEHQSGLGGLNTSIYKPINIVSIYPVNRLCKFFIYSLKVKNNDYDLNYNIYFDRGIIENFNDNENYEYDIFTLCVKNILGRRTLRGPPYYDSLWVENNITEKMMMNNESTWEKIRGGKYVKFDVEYKFPDNELIKDLPNCKCEFPCDVKQNESNNYLYFRCAKKNMWNKMREKFEINDEPCNFFMKYTNDDIYKIEYEYRKQIKKQKIKSLTSKSQWLKELFGIYQYCIGGCGKEYDENNTIRYSGKAINLCFDCFIDKNEELSQKYK